MEVKKHFRLPAKQPFRPSLMQDREATRLNNIAVEIRAGQIPSVTDLRLTLERIAAGLALVSEKDWKGTK